MLALLLASACSDHESRTDLATIRDPISPNGQSGEPDQPGQPIPEPGTLILAGSGLAALAAYNRRRRRPQ